jgi:hypothetical protein
MLNQTSVAYNLEKRCKGLARIIKARRAPPWPCPPTPELPVKHVADALVECYLRTSESVYRVLHIPTFMREYEAVWDVNNNPNRGPDPAFLVQLKLVLAIGASTYDLTFSLRPFAMRAVYEAQTWLAAPEFKSRLGFPWLQTSVLLLFAREATGTGEDMVWASAGTTLRMAIYMGLHRDPGGLGPRTTTPLVAEMRRRLWNTILEVALQSSLDSGGPPLISVDDFDTEPPGNFDDEQLMCESGEDNPTPKPEDQFTQTTLSIALRKMLPQRLAIAKYLNDLASRSTYAETLKHDADLRAASKTLNRTLNACKSTSLQTGGPSDLSLRALDLLLRRYFLSLHLPFLAPALTETAFAYSRKIVVESALRIWRAVFPAPASPSLLPGPNIATADGGVGDLLTQRAISGSALLRTAAVQGFVSIAIEFKTLLREEEGLGLGGRPVELRPDLVAALQDYKVWAWRGLEAGETNTKGYLVACMIVAQVEGIRRGEGDEGTAKLVIAAADEGVQRCLELLTAVVASGESQEGGGALEGVGAGMEVGMEDWDYMVSIMGLAPLSMRIGTDV